MLSRMFRIAIAVWVMTTIVTSGAEAQVFGTFPWQLQPYCNVVTLTLTNTPTGWTLDGVDDQCGATNKGSAVGVAAFSASGNVTLNFTIVTAPSGRAVNVSAVISPVTGSGTWSDDAGNSGTFALFGSAAGLPARPEGHVYFRATGHSNALIGGKVDWTGITDNVGGGVYDPAGAKYAVPATGLYSISYSVGWSAGSVTSGRTCAFIRTTTFSIEMANCIPNVADASFIALTGTSVVPLSAGDTIEIVSNSSATGTTLVSSGSGLTILKVH